jgi:hypothetical protein
MGFQVAGGVMDYYAQKKQAAVDKKNALIAQMFARKAAADAISVGGSAAARALGEGSRTVGSQRAAVAGKGFEIGTGTAQDITDATNLVSSADAFVIRRNAAKTAEGDLKDAYSAGQAAAAAKGPSLLGTILGSASTVATTWSTYSSQKSVGKINDSANYQISLANAGWHI